jgi:hypothetical protein
MTVGAFMRYLLCAQGQPCDLPVVGQLGLPSALTQRVALVADHCKFAYSALACFSMGMSGSAFFPEGEKF